MSGTFIYPDGGNGLTVWGNAAAPISAAFNFNSYPPGAIILISTVPAGAFSGTLPVAVRGMNWTIIDIAGNLSTAAFTVVPNGAAKIQGLAANYIYGVDYGRIHLVSDGTDWWL